MDVSMNYGGFPVQHFHSRNLEVKWPMRGRPLWWLQLLWPVLSYPNSILASRTFIIRGVLLSSRCCRFISCSSTHLKLPCKLGGIHTFTALSPSFQLCWTFNVWPRLYATESKTFRKRELSDWLHLFNWRLSSDTDTTHSARNGRLKMPW